MINKDPFNKIINSLEDEDRIMLEQVSLIKYLKNGEICDKEFQFMAEQAFKGQDDLIIFIPDGEMREFNFLFNDNYT